MTHEHAAAGMRYLRDTVIAGCGRHATAVRPSTSRKAWSSLLLAIFMVALLPACFYGGLLRAEVVGSSSNSNEEHREEHREEAERLEELKNTSPRVRPPVAILPPARPVLVRCEPVAAPRLVNPYIPHPSRYSERRLI